MSNKQIGQEITATFRTEKEYGEYVGKAGILAVIVLTIVAFITL